MADSKPARVTWESWTESLIRQAQAEGRFSGLPGEGAPLPADPGTDDELWWARAVLKRERISFLPASLRIRGETERALDDAMRLDTEAGVRARIEALNERIVRVNSLAFEGPPTTVAPLDVERVVARWRIANSEERETPPQASAPAAGKRARSAWLAAATLATSAGLLAVTALAWWRWGV